MKYRQKKIHFFYQGSKQNKTKQNKTKQNKTKKIRKFKTEARYQKYGDENMGKNHKVKKLNKGLLLPLQFTNIFNF